MNLPQFSLKRPVTVVVAMLVFVTIGIISLVRLPLEMMPDISFPGLMVWVPYPSSSPEEVERTITRPLEDILATINNLKVLRSTSHSSSARIHMEFENGTNMDLASMEIRDKVDQIRDKLPDDVERIQIRRWSTSDFPVISFSLTVPGMPLHTLYQKAEDMIQPDLERIEGVANVDIRGIRNKQLMIHLHPDAFYSSGINIIDLVSTIRNNNINISAGHLEEEKDSSRRRYLVRIPGELKVAEEISRLPLNEKGLRIRDVADITYDYPRKESFYRLNGHEAISFRIYRASNANVVDVCQRVRTVMREMGYDDGQLAGLQTLYFHDQSEEILLSLKDLSIAGLIGGLLAVLTLLFFLRKLRSTVIIAVAIPMALVFTFSFMYLYRAVFNSSISINIISLSGLMMAVGMLVDNGVVVLENIFRMRQEKALAPVEAAVRGSSEVAMAVTASTLTTLVVFASLGFMSSSGFGRWMSDFALTISLALIASLVVSLTFIPLAGSRLLTGKSKPKARWLVHATNGYEKVVSWTIRSWKTRLVTVLAAASILVSTFVMLAGIEREFMPGSEERQLELQVYMPRSITLEEMQALFNRYESIIVRNQDKWAVETFTTDYGTERSRRGRYRGEVSMYLKETGPTIAELKETVKRTLPRDAGISFEFGERRHRGGASGGMRVELIGPDFTRLTELAPRVMDALSKLDIIEDVTSDLEGGDTQLLVTVNRNRAESSGVDSRRVARTIQNSISDRPIGKFKTENKEIDIILNLRNADTLSQDDLRNIALQTGTQRIPLSAVSDFSYRMGSMSIQKENKKSRLSITANANVQGMMQLSETITAAMATIPFPEGYSWSFGRRWQQFQESQQGTNLAIILALVFIYIIMASLFESFVHPFTILLTVPLALFGVALFFTLTGITLNNTSYLGLLTLFGIVVNNGIILIDHIRTLRNQGMEKYHAIVQGGKDRMRPIVMTAITTIFGVLPLALPALLPGLFPGSQGRAQMWAPISVAILGGLTTSTFFTLIILPTFYAIFDSLGEWIKTRLGFVSRQARV
ncbi:MAG TPA: efflux RND transporter permease subunit [Candidatus Aminicenantes bacterium]|nr:efflux RND transporter permease subunit [Candidatus Aminicenantes bacterium]